MTETAKTILVVDDDPVIRDILGAMLESLGYAVSFSANGGECLELLARESPFYYMFLDMFLPDMSGLDLIQQSSLSEEFIRDRLVIVSGNSREEVEEIDTSKKIKHYMAKPFSMTSVREILEELEET